MKMLPLAACLVSLISTSVYANHSVFAEFGQSSAKIDSFKQAVAEERDLISKYDFVSGNSDLDDSASIFRIGYAYQINDVFAVESSFGKFGEIQYKGSIRDSLFNTSANSTVKVDLSGFDVGVKAGHQFTDSFRIFAKAGVASIKAEAEAHSYSRDGYYGFEYNDSEKFDDTTTNLQLGIGADYKFSEQWSARLNYTLINGVEFGDDSSEDDEIDFSLLTFGIAYAF